MFYLIKGFSKKITHMVEFRRVPNQTSLNVSGQQQIVPKRDAIREPISFSWEEINYICGL